LGPKEGFDGAREVGLHLFAICGDRGGRHLVIR
jgi:hypothetical protein